MKNVRRRPTHKQILQELEKRPSVNPVIKENHGDIEDAIVEAGGVRGGLRHAGG